MSDYYVPELGELHLGFQYERLESVLVDNGWNKVYKKAWVPKVADEQYILKYYGGWEFTRDLEDELIRVKILDDDDLVKMGFEHVGGKLIRDVGQEWVHYNGIYYVHLKYTKFSNRAVIRIETSVEEASVRTLVVHSIGIKNISELKRLMEQLNVSK